MRSSPGLPYELTHLADRFYLRERLGQGATSTVWLGDDEASGGVVAVKMGRDAGESTRLADEAERLAVVSSSSLPALIDAGRIPGAEGRESIPYVVLERIDGEALDPKARLNAGDREALALLVARDAAAALSDLHRAGLHHGDVKPKNVIVSSHRDDRKVFDHARLVDLGLAGDANENIARGGTPRYLAPEVFAADHLGDGRARDLWALGVTIAEVASATVAGAASPARVALASELSELPAAVRRIVRALLAPAAHARPDAEWVHRRAAESIGGIEPALAIERRRRSIQRGFLAAHGSGLRRIGRSHRARCTGAGLPGRWLAEAAAKMERVRELRGRQAEDELALGELDLLGKRRWLTACIGPEAARWPSVAGWSDEDIAERLLQLCDAMDPGAITYADLAAPGAKEQPAPAVSEDPVELALSLAVANPSRVVIRAAEEHALTGDGGSLRLALALARTLRLRGELGRALAVLDRHTSPEARVEAAEALRRAGDLDGATEQLRRAPADPTAAWAVRYRSVSARIAYDRGDRQGAKQVLAGFADDALGCEVRALLALEEGDFEESRQAMERGRALCGNDEERSRLEAVDGNLSHALGEARRALDAFRRAADCAMRASAVLEEATYLTGVAATAFDVGELGEALDAAGRATLLFEHLGRPREAARALLSRAAVYSAVRAVPQTREATRDAAERARVAGDARCRAFAHLTMADALGPGNREGLEHARRAQALLEDATPTDRLRASARLLFGEDVIESELDALAADPTIASTARLEWWGARAVKAASESSPIRADRIVAELNALANEPAPLRARGEALSAGMRLAARIGDGDSARRLAIACAEAARRMTAGAPDELKLAVAALDWIQVVRAPGEGGMAPEQLTDIESLVRALGTRDRLRPLLDQVLDALVLWTGVERGLLLLRAPGGKLAPRAARNLARSDLVGAQLALSKTLAERALSTEQPVVAVDAAGELSEVHESVHALKLRSVLAVPLIARGEALGVVYLDDRIRRGAFGPRELSWVRLVATLAAVAIADARDQILLRRAARRAARAESRVQATLAVREAELSVAQNELARVRDARPTRFSYDDIVGKSERVQGMLRIVDRVTASEVPVLIVGESGSGKELVARAIHRNGPRATEAFVTENCAAIPEGLLESALFGHVRGAFTGASRPRAGLFEVANGGTLFLDEIGEMSLAMQTKLLRVLEDGELRPVGSERSRKVDVRVIAATHRDLDVMVEKNLFRRDLYYRLNVIRIDIPPLRERGGDIDLLVRHFLCKHAVGRSIRVSRSAGSILSAYRWPGNIRQLENEVRRALVMADEIILPEHLSKEIVDSSEDEAARPDGLNIRRRVDALESELVCAALERTGGNQTRAAELLGLSRFGLQKMMKRLNITAASSSPGREGRAELIDPR